MFIASLLASVALMKAGPIYVTPDVTDGQTISRPTTIKVRVQSDSLVTQVEFYVGDDLRDSATSTPYTFKLDPINEKDGDLKLTFIAYTSPGDKGSKSVTVKIDTGVGRGAEANTKDAEDALVGGKWDDAIGFARTALKAKPDYNPARMVMAKAYLHKGVFDKAQQFAEDVVHASPNDNDALSLLSAIEIEKAMSTYSHSGDQNATLAEISGALKAAVDVRRKVIEAQFDALPAPTPENRLHYANVAIRSGHFSAAISALAPAFNSDLKPDTGNRIAYAQLRLGRWDDLIHTLGLMEKAKTMNACSFALAATQAEFRGDRKAADDAMTEALGDNPEDLSVRSTAVYIALRRGKVSSIAQLANNLANDQGQRSEVSYYLAILNTRLKRYLEADKAFKTSVLAEPLNYEMYIERGNEALGRAYVTAKTERSTSNYELKVAESMFQTALEAKPDAPDALAGLALVRVVQERIEEAADMAAAAAKASPDYAAGRLVAGYVFRTKQAALQQKCDRILVAGGSGIDAESKAKADQFQAEAYRYRDMARAEFEAAAKYDPPNLAGNKIPNVVQVFNYFYIDGQLPLILPPS